MKTQLEMARIVEAQGADTLMEVSAADDPGVIRRAVIQNTNLPVGNVPLYQAFDDTIRKTGYSSRLDPEYLFDLTAVLIFRI
ncbi:MAG: phosphomethylpyrimidine synthase ThiC [Desulfobacteraceae bacterium]|nr:phosphomethylpyrimidine synthase ThiC [Desulfobacteraceae bacterium]